MNYTTVVGVDAHHLEQLALTWPTWRRHKPSLLDHPMVVFYDTSQLTEAAVCGVVDHPYLKVIPWPLGDAEYLVGDGEDRWSGAQRYKMLAGFVYVPAAYVETDYWLKIDTDTIALGQDDWIDPSWFEGKPAIVSQKWGFTKRKLSSWGMMVGVSYTMLSASMGNR